MIFDNIKNRATYSDNIELSKVLEFMAGCSPENFPSERVVLDEDRIFVNPVTLTTKPESECCFEGHRRYADVHYIISGCEGIAVNDITLLEHDGQFDPSIDFGKWRGKTKVQMMLYPGDFLVCYPQDAHKVAMMNGQPGAVVKLVGKIEIKGWS